MIKVALRVVEVIIKRDEWEREEGDVSFKDLIFIY